MIYDVGVGQVGTRIESSGDWTGLGHESERNVEALSIDSVPLSAAVSRRTDV